MNRSILTLLAACASATLSIPQLRALDFDSSLTATGPEAGGICAITTDGAGRLHSVWTRERDGGGRELKYTLQLGDMHLQGGHRVRDFSAGEVPEHVDIEVDRNGKIHLLYILTTGEVVYACREPSASGWEFDNTTLPEAEPGMMGGCAIDCISIRGERVAIAYTGEGGTLKVFRNFNGGSWSDPTFNSSIGTTLGIGYHPSLAYVTDPDSPSNWSFVISHFDANLGALRIHEVDGLMVQGATIDSEGSSGHNSSIAALPDGTLGVSYQMTDPNTGASELRYASGSLGDFTIETVDASSDYGTPPAGSVFTVAQQTALSVDANGHPMIAYTQGQIAFILPNTQQLRFSRLIPGFGWDEHPIALTPSGTGVTNGLDLTTNGAGDPAILFESDGGTTSELRLARPTTRPFVLDSPEFVVDGSGRPISYSAPAVATAPDGTVFTALTTESAGISRLHFNISRPGGRNSQLEIPTNDFRRINATALAWTRDEIVHLFTMQVNSPNASAGDLHYTSVDGIATTSNPVLSSALAVPPSVTTTPDGTLHLAFVHSSGELRYMTKALGEAGFTIRHARDLDGGRGLSIDARPDGGVAISFVHPETREVRILDNVTRHGTLTTTFDQQAAYFPGGGDPAPKNAAVRFTNDGTPRVLFGLANTLRLARPTSSGFPLYTSSQVAGGTSNAYVNLHADRCGGEMIAVVASEDGDGTARYLRVGNDGGLSAFEAFLRHGRNAYTYDHNPVAIAPAIDSALDAHGYPVAVLPIQVEGTGRGEVIIARAADGIDHDGDGMPLVVENALGADPFVADVALAPRVTTQRFGSSGSRHDFFFRVPSYLGPTEILSNGLAYGEFEYTLTASTELDCFVHPLNPPFPSGAIIVDGGKNSLGDGDAEHNLRLLFNVPFTAANPHAFTRLNVARLR